jgi:cell shape-determining protein MreD
MELYLIIMGLTALYLVTGYGVTLLVERRGGHWHTWWKQVIGVLIWFIVLLLIAWSSFIYREKPVTRKGRA